jgi:beta-lactamase regulating signal transducer with metallopeptidase domain
MESLVHAMLNNALASTILAVLVAAFAWGHRRPALVHSLWLVVLLKLITPPAVLLPLPGVERLMPPSSHPDLSLADCVNRPPAPASSSPNFPVDERDSYLGDARSQSPAGDLIEVGSAVRASSDRSLLRTPRSVDVSQLSALVLAWKWEHWLLVVFSSGAVARWVLALVRIVRFQRLLREVEPIDHEWQARANALAKRVGLRGCPPVYLAPGRVPPLIWAIGGRPRLLVPSELWIVTGEDERMTLVLHELAHLKRRDHWVRWLELVVVGLYWWNPVVLWACSRLREAEEECCDAWVVWAMPQGSKTYAAALLTVLDFISGVPTAPAVASAMGAGRHVSCLKRRLRMIVSAKTPRGLSWAGRFAVLGAAALLLPLSPSWGQQHNVDQSLADSDRAAEIVANRVQATTGAQHVSAVAMREQEGATQGKERELAERFEDRVRDLIAKLAKEVGPVTDEVRKALESAVDEIDKALEKGDLSADDVRKSLEKSHDEMRRAFEKGGPVEKEVREAWARSRQELHDAWERTREDLRTAVRERSEAERQRERAARDRAVGDRERDRTRNAPDDGKIKEGEGQPGRSELESAQNEVQELRRQLMRATQRLQEIQRRERESRRIQPPRREASPRAEPNPSRNPGAPRAEPAPAAAPRSPSAPAAPARPAPLRGGGQVQPRGSRDGRRDQPSASERRLRELEDKMNQLLKELKDLKDEQKKETKGPTAEITQLT